MSKSAIGLTISQQTPLIDANGNGIANEDGDFVKIQNMALGGGIRLAGNAPTVGGVSPDRTISGTNTASFAAENVADADGIARVWAVVRPPNYTQNSSLAAVDNLPSFDLMPVSNNRYEATYDGFTALGTYKIAIYARDRLGNTSIPVLTTLSVTNPLTRKAIIVAGGGTSDPLWSAYQENAQLAYQALTYQGYGGDDIYYLSSAMTVGVDGTPTIANLTYGITTWAKTNTQDLTLYLVGGGDNGTFKLSGAEILPVATLDGWLDDLQNSITGEVTIIYDGSNSGSFVGGMTAPAGKKRMSIVSSNASESAAFLSDGDISFSSFFWKQVLNGATLQQAFNYAKRAITFSNKSQTPWLDADGNGVANQKADVAIASAYSIGAGIMFAGDEPYIDSVSPEQALNGRTSVAVWADGIATTGIIDTVIAVVTPPAGSSPNQPYTITLTSVGNGRYEGTIEGFSIYGEYEIAIFAKDKKGNLSLHKKTKIHHNTETQVSGGELIENTSWSVSQSPYHLLGNLIILTGITLTIEPGVTIKIDNGKAIQVDGTLIARGTSENKIVFTSSQTTPVAGSWGFIKFTDSSIDATFDASGNYTSGSILQYCKIQYAGGGSVPDAVIVEKSAPFIDNCEIAYTKGAGIYANNPPSIRITNNNIHHSQKIGNGYSITGGGIAIDGGSAIIKGNALSNNAGEQRGGGITLRSISASTLVDGNTITNNTGNGNDSGAGGIHVGGNSAVITISNNTVDGNSGSSGYGGGAGGIKVHYNTADVVIDSNTVINNTGDCGINLGGGGFGPSAHATIQNNTIKNNSSSGIQVFGDNQPTVISGNTIQNNKGSGVNIAQGQNITIQNNTVESNNGGISVGSGSGQTISGNTIRNNTGTGLSLGSGSGSVSTNTVTGNSSSGISVSNANWIIHNNNLYGNTSYDLYYSGGSGTTLDAKDNWWGTTNASDIDMDVYDKYDDLVKGISNFSTLLPYAGALILGPTNPFISILKRSGTVKNPVLTLLLGADGPPADMKITEDPEFPPPVNWETFAATKEFKGDGTKYIYAKYRDASANESAIAFVRPRGVFYIQKNKTLASRPVNIKVRVAEVYTKKYPDLIAKLYYRGIGESTFQQAVMDLVDNVHQAWIPAERTVNGIEYYIMVEDGLGIVLTSLPESNPSTQPMSMSADQLVTEALEKGKDIELELAMGVTVKLPASALVSDTNLVVKKPETELAAFPGITPLGIGFDVFLENGTKTFTEPVQMAIGYNHKEISEASQKRLRVYYRRDDGLIRLVQGFVDLLTKEFKFSTNHFSSFFLAEASDAYPALPISWTQGQPLVVKISVLNGVPLSQATLYYRSGEKNDWTALAMNKSGDFLEATIPGNDVAKSGLSYYIEGTDGETSATSSTVAVYTGEDNYEIDDSYAKASVIVLNHDYPQIHNFHAAGDEDWVKFYAQAGIVYEFKTSNLGQMADVVLELYDTDGITLLASVDDGIDGQDELLSWTAPKKGIYYVRVRQYYPGVFGPETNYDLRIYRPVAPDIGTIRGIVVSDAVQARISGVVVLASLGSAISSNGEFLLRVEAGTVNVQAEADGYKIATLQNVQVQAGQETTVNISLSPVTATLTVSKMGNGVGIVTSNPSGISCGVGCTTTYSSGTSVTLTAAPDTGSTFIGWTGDCAGTSLACTVTMDQARAATATFGDITKPVGSITFVGGPYTSAANVTLTLDATDITGLAGMKFSWDGGVTWSLEEPYSVTKSWNVGTENGMKTAYVKFKDKAGNWSDAYRYDLFLDTVGPVLNVQYHGQCTSEPVLTVSGTVSDALSGLKSLTINGATATLQNGIFSQALILTSGANAIEIAATDNADVVTTHTREITLDQTAPVLTVSDPGEQGEIDLITGAAMIDVKGTVNESAIVTIKVNNDDPVTAPILNNTFSYPATLLAGTNVIEVKAVDCGGNSSTVVRTAVYDNDNPALSVTEPSVGMFTNQNVLTIRGSVSALTGITLTIKFDGNSYPVAVTDGIFEQTITFTAEKTYRIEVTAIDNIGHTATVTRDVVYDKTKPVFSINEVTSLTNQDHQTLSGTREAAAIITAICTTATVGTITYPSETTWNVTMTNLTEGNNAITLTAQDLAGNRSAPYTASIVLDTSAPVTTSRLVLGTAGRTWSVTLSANEDAIIYYTLNGQEPTLSSNKYDGPIPLTDMTTVTFFARDSAMNVEKIKSVTYLKGIIGDLNDDGYVAMADAIIALQTMMLMNPVGIRSDYGTSNADVNGDGQVGMPEVIFIMQTLSGSRN